MQAVKPWFQSKTIWGIVLAGVIYVLNVVFGITPGVVPDWLVQAVTLLMMVLSGLGRAKATTALSGSKALTAAGPTKKG